MASPRPRRPRRRRRPSHLDGRPGERARGHRHVLRRAVGAAPSRGRTRRRTAPPARSPGTTSTSVATTWSKHHLDRGARRGRAPTARRSDRHAIETSSGSRSVVAVTILGSVIRAVGRGAVGEARGARRRAHRRERCLARSQGARDEPLRWSRRCSTRLPGLDRRARRRRCPRDPQVAGGEDDVAERHGRRLRRRRAPSATASRRSS